MSKSKRKKNKGNVRTFLCTDKPVTEDGKIDRGMRLGIWEQ